MAKPHKENNSKRKTKKDQLEFAKQIFQEIGQRLYFLMKNFFNLRDPESYFKYWGNTNDEGGNVEYK